MSTPTNIIHVRVTPARGARQLSATLVRQGRHSNTWAVYRGEHYLGVLVHARRAGHGRRRVWAAEKPNGEISVHPQRSQALTALFN